MIETKPEITPDNWPKELSFGSGGMSEVRAGAKQCVMQAVNWIRNQHETDDPECVHWADRRILIEMNDWSDKMDPEYRSRELYPLALKALNTYCLDRDEFLDYIISKVLLRVTGRSMKYSEYGCFRISPRLNASKYYGIVAKSTTIELTPYNYSTQMKVAQICSFIENLGFYTMKEIILESYEQTA